MFHSILSEAATWIMFIAVAVGAYLGYKYITTDDFLKNDRFAVMNKDIIEGASFTDPSRRTSLGAPQRVTYPSKYLLVVQGEHTSEQYIVVVSEEMFRYTPLRTILDQSELAHMPYFENFREMEEYYQKIETSPEPAAGEGFFDKLLSFLGLN